MKEIVQLISGNEELQETIAKNFEDFSRQFMKIWSEVSGLPKIREILLSDEDYISQKLSTNYRFFDGLPQDCGYLISLYDVAENSDSDALVQLYQKYYGDILSQSEINEIALYHMELASEPNIYMLSTKDRMEDITSLLRHISSDRDFYKNMKALGSRCNLDYKVLLAFVQKYGDTALYAELMDSEHLSESTVEKIIYLASEGKVEDIQSLSDVEGCTLEELQKKDKQRSRKVFTNARGGPRSQTNARIFPTCDSREVVRINPDGSFKPFPMDQFGMRCPHEVGVEGVYDDCYTFTDEKATAIQKSLEVAKHLGAVTLIIENERCFIVMPDEITDAQKSTCKMWIDSAIDEGELGLFVYDSARDDMDVPFGEKTISPSQMLDYIINKRQIEFPDMAELTQHVCSSDFNRAQREIGDEIEPEHPEGVK